MYILENHVTGYPDDFYILIYSLTPFLFTAPSKIKVAAELYFTHYRIKILSFAASV